MNFGKAIKAVKIRSFFQHKSADLNKHSRGHVFLIKTKPYAGSVENASIVARVGALSERSEFAETRANRRRSIFTEDGILVLIL